MEGKNYKDFHELSIWKNGFTLLMEIYKLTETFPESEKYSLTSQILRSANSIITNIAEAHGRYSFNDKIRVLYISRGEIFETRSHLAVAFGRRYVDKMKFSSINSNYCQLAIDLNAYINSLRQ